MINAAIVGLGWWGKTLVESAQGSDAIRFVAAGTRAVSPEIRSLMPSCSPPRIPSTQGRSLLQRRLESTSFVRSRSL